MKSTIDIQFQIELAMRQGKQICFLAQSLDHIEEIETIARAIGICDSPDWTPDLVDAAVNNDNVYTKFSNRLHSTNMDAWVLIKFFKKSQQWQKELHNHPCGDEYTDGIWIVGDHVYVTYTDLIAAGHHWI